MQSHDYILSEMDISTIISFFSPSYMAPSIFCVFTASLSLCFINTTVIPCSKNDSVQPVGYQKIKESILSINDCSYLKPCRRKKLSGHMLH